MDATDTSTADVDRALERFGRMNFYQLCTVDGHYARLTMNGERVFLAVHAGDVDVHTEPFMAVRSTGAGRTRRVHFGERVYDVDFHDDAHASRFSRVLDARQNPYGSSSTQPSMRAAQHAANASPAPGHPSSPHHKYRVYATWVMVFSSVLLVLGTLDLLVGVIGGLVALATGHGWNVLVFLLLAVLGSAGPFCLACLARMIVYRDRAAGVLP